MHKLWTSNSIQNAPEKAYDFRCKIAVELVLVCFNICEECLLIIFGFGRYDRIKEVGRRHTRLPNGR
jgi:hypothetical protein